MRKYFFVLFMEKNHQNLNSDYKLLLDKNYRERKKELGENKERVPQLQQSNLYFSFMPDSSQIIHLLKP